MNRFWNKVVKTKTCWNWIASKLPSGYGRFSFNGSPIYAHRFSWFLVNAKWPKKNVLHKCDNPSCVRPSHLFEGTQCDNNKDRARKGRSYQKITKKIEKKIIQLHRKKWIQEMIAIYLNITQSSVSRTLSRY